MTGGRDEDYRGLPVAIARERALADGWTSVRVLEPGAMMTMDHREGRLNLGVREGVVERSWEG